jgi:hypothetical protein
MLLTNIIFVIKIGINFEYISKEHSIIYYKVRVENV